MLAMKDTLFSLTSIALTIICWGVYGPVLHKGQAAMDQSRLRPFLCVGLAYFAIAVIVPAVLLATSGEKGNWSFTGVVWSLAGGVAGAIGALGIIMAFNFGKNPAIVMPLVFGCAPVVSTFVTIYLARITDKPSPIYLAGIILVAMGAFITYYFAPKAHATPAKPAAVSTAATSKH
jgi:hypothetical protein